MTVRLIEVTEGPLAGSRFKVKAGVRIGRTTGDILLDDPKVSSLHAQFEQDAKGGLVLVDRGSANGLRINSQKVKRVAMLPGVRFLVGKTSFRVLEEVVEDDPPPLHELSWSDVLRNALSDQPLKNPPLAVTSPFKPLVQLRFTQGLQYQETWTLGFGPRSFGSDQVDFELLDPVAPPVAFELFPTENGAAFKTPYPKLVLVNESSSPEVLLQEGDVIRIGQTLIQVSFLK